MNRARILVPGILAATAAICVSPASAQTVGATTAATATTRPLPAALTPPAAPTPRVNGPTIFGVRPGSPFLYSIPATGERPMTFGATGLPDGLTLDATTGRISGKVVAPGEFKVTLRATNARGAAEKPFRVVVGEAIALTPAMGWNSWNCFGPRVTQAKVRRAAQRIVELGLDRHGWTYVNVDDAWQGRTRGAGGGIDSDPATFPDMKGLADQIHALGLKAGLYHTPWTKSYAGRLGATSEHEDGQWGPLTEARGPRNQKKLPHAIGKFHFVEQDAKRFAEWGFDYLKYDWGPVEAPETREMATALRATGRDVVLSLSNNAAKNLLPLIEGVSPHAQSWRTTTDINDTYNRVFNVIGFAQDAWAAHARPGHVNDADMLVVGHVGGWSGKPAAPTRLAPDEQYAHVALWSLLSSPLLIGCDLEQMDAFTLGLLTNDEVIDVNQDALCKQAVQVGGDATLRVYAKPMEDGSLAVGLFNQGDAPASVAARWADLKLDGKRRVRDLWRQQDLGLFEGEFKAEVAPHGVVLVRLSAAR